MPAVKTPKQKSQPQPKPLAGRGLAALALVALLFVMFSGGKQVGNISMPRQKSDGFNKRQHSVNDPSSIWAVVNKGRMLPGTYIPSDLTVPDVTLRLPESDPEMQLRAEPAAALQSMFAESSRQNIHLMLSSAYRPYKEQVGLYKGYVAAQGQQNADSSSARPGYSEHQLGLAADIEPANRECEVKNCFADTPAGKWAAANAYKYGFIIRYQKDRVNLTGYEYEPWHMRYVGKPLAEQIQQNNQTLEQFFGLPAFTNYSDNPYQLASGK
jgi:D-alanyl-D-alanine carboxypeptidase